LLTAIPRHFGFESRVDWPAFDVGIVEEMDAHQQAVVHKVPLAQELQVDKERRLNTKNRIMITTIIMKTTIIPITIIIFQVMVINPIITNIGEARTSESLWTWLTS
jgi:hypothetical protein